MKTRVEPKTAKHPSEAIVPLSSLEVEKGFNTTKVQLVGDLEVSFKEAGMENPLHVRERDGSDKLFVIDGRHRFLAAQKVGWKEIRVVNHGLIDDVEARTVAYRQNLLRRKPSKKELMDTCKFFQKAGLGVSEIAQRMCLGKSSVSEYLTLLRATPKLRRAAAKGTSEGGIPTKAALRAARLPEAQQRRATPKLAGKTSREAEQVLGPPRPRILTTSPGIASGHTQNTGVLMPGEKLPHNYRLVSDYKERCQKLELEVTKRLRQTPSSQRLQGMELVIGVLRGKLTVEQAFVDWQKV